MSTAVGFFTGKITIADIRTARPEKIFYGANTCWWTHDSAHLCRHESGLPCDPRGGMLFETTDVEGFLHAAEEEAKRPGCHYGRHGIKAFEAAHHLNCVVGKNDPRHTCFENWDDYNRLLDETGDAA